MESFFRSLCIVFISLSPLVLSFTAKAQDNGTVEGYVVNSQGRTLGAIEVEFYDSSGNVFYASTDAYGRYSVTDIPEGTYQVFFADRNFTIYDDEDPYPDSGPVYAGVWYGGTTDQQSSTSVVITKNTQTLNKVTLVRVDNADQRQSVISVSDCDQFGTANDPGTLAAGLEYGKVINFICSGTITVPELIFTKDTIINGKSGLVFNAGGASRVIRVQPGVMLEMSRVQISGGGSSGLPGAGLYNLGHTMLADSIITGNGGGSGSLYNDRGRLTLANVSISRNSTIYETLVNSGTITGENITVEKHQPSAGPAIVNNGVIDFTQCKISQLGTNNVFAVSNNMGADLTLRDCEIFDNLGSSLITNRGNTTIERSSVYNNAGDQELFRSSGVFNLIGTTINNNDSQSVVIANSGLADIVNSTISANESGPTSPLNAEGAIGNTGLLRIVNSTIVGNLFLVPQDSKNTQLANSGELRISNSIIVGIDGYSECSGSASVISDGYNLQSDGSCGTNQSSDIAFGNAALAELEDNGGPGKTHALLATSQALDSGDCNAGSITTDQRGIARPQGSGCDIGAYEVTSTVQLYCGDTATDSDGDGWGWENGRSCRVKKSTERQVCSNADSDTDGDGWGWENGKSCQVKKEVEKKYCADPASDTDGDGWGWENGKSCRVNKGTEKTYCNDPLSDTDGDGWGWENSKSCRVKS